MPITLRNEGLVSTVRLTGAATIYEASGLRDCLRGVVEAGGPVSIDLTEVTHCDLTLLQLLVATRRSAELRHVTLTCPAISDAVQDTLAAAGLAIEAIQGAAKED